MGNWTAKVLIKSPWEKPKIFKPLIFSTGTLSLLASINRADAIVDEYMLAFHPDQFPLHAILSSSQINITLLDFSREENLCWIKFLK